MRAYEVRNNLVIYKRFLVTGRKAINLNCCNKLTTFLCCWQNQFTDLLLAFISITTCCFYSRITKADLSFTHQIN